MTTTQQIGLVEPIAETLHNNMQPRTNDGVEYCQKMVNASLARVLALVVTSTCDQAVTVRLVGHTVDSATDENGLVDIGSGLNLAATNGKLVISVVVEEAWMPYMAVRVIAGATAPSSGRIVVQAFGQKWVSGE